MPSDFAGALQREMPGIRWLNEIGLAFMSSKVIVTGIEVGLFTALAGGPLTVDQVAERVSVEPDLAGRLLTACTAIGLVRRSDGRFWNSDDVDKYLVEGRPSYFGGYLRQFVQERYPLFDKLERTVKTGQPLFDGEYYIRLQEDLAAVREFTESGYTGSISMGHVLAKHFDFSKRSLLLDLGGGSGAFCIAACTRNPQLKAIVLDHRNVVAIAREFIERANLSDRITTVAGNFITDEYPSGADVILNSSNLHFYEYDTARAFFRKAFNALQPGGAMIWLDYMLNDERTGPPVPAMIELSGCFWTARGRVYTAGEVTDLMAEAGFVNMERLDFVPGQLGRVIGHKP